MHTCLCPITDKLQPGHTADTPTVHQGLQLAAWAAQLLAMLAMFQHHHVVAWAHLFTCLWCPKTRLHICPVPVPPPTGLGTPIHTLTMCQCCSATWQPGHDFSHIPVLPSSDLGTLRHTCYVSRAATWLPAHTWYTLAVCQHCHWWPGNTCLHVCSVSEPPTGGQHMPLHFRNTMGST